MKKCYRVFAAILILLAPHASRLAPSAHAAVGDEAMVCSSVAANATLDAVTTGTVVRNVVNVIFEDNIELQIFDGTNTLPFAQYIGPGIKQFLASPLAATASGRPRFKNLNVGAARLICYQWIEVKT